MDGLDEHGSEWNGIGYAVEDLPAGSFLEADFKHGQIRLRRPNATTATPPEQRPTKPNWRAPDPFSADDCLRVFEGQPVAYTDEQLPASQTRQWEQAGIIKRFRLGPDPDPYLGPDEYELPVRRTLQEFHFAYIGPFNIDIINTLFNSVILPEYDRDHAIHPFTD